MSNFPLLNLLKGNLQDAQTLHLLAPESSEIDDFLDKVNKGWPTELAPSAQLSGYQNSMLFALSTLTRSHRPLQALQGEKVRLVTVRPFSRFVQWATILQSDADRFGLRKLCELAVDPMNCKSDLNFGRAGDACIALNDQFGVSSRGGRRGSFLPAAEIQPKRLSFWVGRPTSDPSLQTAQYWRDKLGLIDIQGLAPKVGNLLVRIELGVDLAASALPPIDSSAHVLRENDGIWLVRPTMVHLGNQRFVQRHLADTDTSRPDTHGRTRDLSSSVFQAAELELMLIYGARAKLEFVSVELLSGFADQNTSMDNSDERFAEIIGKERGW
jgi:hypothetical protein